MTTPPGAPERAMAEDRYKSTCAGQHMTADEYAAFEAGWDAATEGQADTLAQAVQAAEFKTAAHIWYSVLDLIAAGTPIDGLRTIATQQAAALRARSAKPQGEK